MKTHCSHPFIHLSIIHFLLNSRWQGSARVSLSCTSAKAGWLPAQVTPLTHTPKVYSEFPSWLLTCMSLECGRNPENPERTYTHTQEEHVKSTQNGPIRLTVLTTAPPSLSFYLYFHYVQHKIWFLQNVQLLWTQQNCRVALWLKANSQSLCNVFNHHSVLRHVR